MNGIGGCSWGFSRNLWIFIRNAIEQHRRVDPPRPWEPVKTPARDVALEKNGHIDLQV
jgi:hypothetical protein